MHVDMELSQYGRGVRFAGLILAAVWPSKLPNRYVSRAFVHMDWNAINENERRRRCTE